MFCRNSSFYLLQIQTYMSVKAGSVIASCPSKTASPTSLYSDNSPEHFYSYYTELHSFDHSESKQVPSTAMEKRH